MDVKRIVVLLQKEFAHGSKSFFFIFAVVTPLATSLLVSLLFGRLFAQPARLGVLAEENSQVAQALRSADILVTRSYGTLAELEQAVEDGQVDVGIVLQPGFDQRLQVGEQNQLNFYIWGESLIRHRMAAAAVMSNALVTVLDRPVPVSVRPVSLDGGNVPWFDRLLPLLVLLAVIMNGILVPGSALVEEKQRRTLGALLMTPLSLGEILVTKGLLGMILSLGMGLLILLINRSLGTQPVLLLVALALGSLLSACLGLILGVISKDIPSMFATIKGLMLLLYAPGIIYAIPQIPQWIGRFFPTYYIFDPVIQITQNSANLTEIVWEMAVLIGLILLVMLALAGLLKKTRLQGA